MKKKDKQKEKKDPLKEVLGYIRCSNPKCEEKFEAVGRNGDVVGCPSCGELVTIRR